MRALGYAVPLLVRPGDTVEFKISSELASYDAELVRLTRGGSVGEHELLESAVDAPVNGTYEGAAQPTWPGSYVWAAVDPSLCATVHLECWMEPTQVRSRRPQAVLSAVLAGRSLSLGIVSGEVVVMDEQGVPLASSDHEVDGGWCHAAVEIDLVDAACTFQIDGTLLGPRPLSAGDGAAARRGGQQALTEFLAGAGRRNGVAVHHYNGRVASPRMSARSRALGEPNTDPGASLEVCWDFSRQPESATVFDRGAAGADGTCVNLPTRSVLGPAESDRVRVGEAADRESLLDAIHFHDDDLEDAGWKTTAHASIPTGLASGVYALKLVGEEVLDRIPFVVGARPEGPRAGTVLVVLPTWTYLAYANWRSYLVDRASRAERYGGDRDPDPRDAYLVDHPELGLSLYDVHSDGSGVAYSSALRPILTMRPDYRATSANGLRNFSADLYIIDLLERAGIPYAVSTDDQVHAEGSESLRDYPCVITGTHPEYVSGRIIDAYLGYYQSGGRVMYLGGNGFYWVTATSEHRQHVIEIRRGQRGISPWQSRPGEETLSLTGETGGLWRETTRPPQSVVGVEFCAQVFDRASPYRRTPASHDSRLSWIFDGVDTEVFGQSGFGLGGAAGDEIDCRQRTSGLPGRSWLLARSEGHSARLEAAPEYAEVVGGEDPARKSAAAELVLTTNHAGGAVFATGSMHWMSAAGFADGDNAVARITVNVCRRFLSTAPVDC